MTVTPVPVATPGTVAAPFTAYVNDDPATGAKQDTGNASLATIAAAVTAATPAGTNTIGKLAANSGVDIGDVDITSVTPGTAATNLGKAIDSVAGATDTGVAMLATRLDTLATLTPASGDYVSPRVNARGAQWVALDSTVAQTVTLASQPALVAGSALVGDIVQAQRATTNGLTSSRVVSAASTNATSLKTSAGRIGRIDVFNTSASLRYLKLYNKASAPTVGTDTPVWTIPLPAATGFSSDFAFGKYFSTGIAYAITGALADSDTTAVAAGDVHGSIDWI